MSDLNTHLPEPGSGTDIEQTVISSKCNQTDCESATHTIATAISKVTGKDPTEIPPALQYY